MTHTIRGTNMKKEVFIAEFVKKYGSLPPERILKENNINIRLIKLLHGNLGNYYINLGYKNLRIRKNKIYDLYNCRDQFIDTGSINYIHDNYFPKLTTKHLQLCARTKHKITKEFLLVEVIENTDMEIFKHENK